MARIFITGSVDGLGRLAAERLQAAGHELVLHARSPERLATAQPLVDAGAVGVVGDLTDVGQTREVAAAVNALGPVDAVIHNAGVYIDQMVFPINVVAPYLLTALVDRPRRLVYLSSGLHRSGRPDLGRVDWTGRAGGSYADSKLLVTTLMAAVARRWPEVLSNAVDPGWVPTKMGGAGAPDDLTLGHRTQEWLATSDDPPARTTGGYWHHQQLVDPHPAVSDEAFQDELLDALAQYTGTSLAP